MNKKIRLTETDFRKLVSQILNEQNDGMGYPQMLDKIAAATTFIKPIGKTNQSINWGYTMRDNLTFPWRYDVSISFEGANTFFVLELSIYNSNTNISSEVRKFLASYPNISKEILGGGNRFMLTYNGFNINQLKEVIEFSQKILQICTKYTSGKI